MGVDGVAHALHHGVGPGRQAGRGRRRNHIDRAADKTGGADLLEIKIAGEIVGARRQRLQRRIEHRFDFDERARGWRQPALDREPDALRLVVDAVAVDAIDAQHEAVGVLALFTQFDKARDGHARGRIMQHRVLDHGGFHRRGGKAGGDGENKKADDQSGQMSAQQYRAGRADRGKRRRRPPCRLTLRGEIDDDAKAVGDREPWQQAIGGNFLRRPLPQLCGEGEIGARPYDMPRRANADRPRPMT